MDLTTIKLRIKKIRNSQVTQHRTIVESLNAIVEYLEEREPNIKLTADKEGTKKSFLESKKGVKDEKSKTAVE